MALSVLFSLKAKDAPFKIIDLIYSIDSICDSITHMLSCMTKVGLNAQKLKLMHVLCQL